MEKQQLEFKKYKRKGLSEMIAFKEFIGQNMTKLSVSDQDKLLSNEEFEQGYIARNPKNHEDIWYVSKKYFDDNLEPCELVIKMDTHAATTENSNKTLINTTASQAKDNVKDIVFWGYGDTFKLISKASSKNEGWMKSTKAMEIEGVGCVVQVTTQQGDNVAEALTFVPNVKIDTIYTIDTKTNEKVIMGRKLINCY